MSDSMAVIGAGGMGTVCATLLAGNGASVRLWCRDSHRAESINSARINERHLPSCRLPDNVQAGSDPAWVLEGASLVISAVPCQYTRSVWEILGTHLPAGVPMVSVTKGIENDTLLCATQILAQLCGRRYYAALSGPCIADEVARRLPTSVVVAGAEPDLVRFVQQAFNTDRFRVYTNSDVIGVELSGAVKNVIAIAAGILDGMELGDNAKASLVTRGLVEITRLGLAMGAKSETFSGLAGVGDLITTCTSPHSRNHTAGRKIGQGVAVKDVLASTPAVIEGVPTTRSVVVLSQKLGIEMPIAQAVDSVLFDSVPPAAAIHDLMTRQLKAE